MLAKLLAEKWNIDMKLSRGILKLLFGPASLSVIAHLRTMNWAKRSGMCWLCRAIEYRMQRHYGVYISCKADVADRVYFPHPNGIVIGEGVTIGANTTIYQHVTLGAARISEADDRAYPHVSEDCQIYAGAVIVGAVKVGRAATIGANSFVNEDVPDGATAIGTPARIKLRRHTDADAKPVDEASELFGREPETS